MAEIDIPAPLASALRALLQKADADPVGAVPAEDWRRSRDGWLDVVDPINRLLLPGQAIELLSFLAEAVPSAESRMTRAEWRAAVERVTPQLIGLTG